MFSFRVQKTTRSLFSAMPCPSAKTAVFFRFRLIGQYVIRSANTPLLSAAPTRDWAAWWFRNASLSPARNPAYRGWSRSCDEYIGLSDHADSAVNILWSKPRWLRKHTAVCSVPQHPVYAKHAWSVGSIARWLLLMPWFLSEFFRCAPHRPPRFCP